MSRFRGHDNPTIQFEPYSKAATDARQRPASNTRGRILTMKQVFENLYGFHSKIATTKEKRSEQARK